MHLLEKISEVMKQNEEQKENMHCIMGLLVREWEDAMQLWVSTKASLTKCMSELEAREERVKMQVDIDAKKLNEKEKNINGLLGKMEKEKMQLEQIKNLLDQKMKVVVLREQHIEGLLEELQLSKNHVEKKENELIDKEEYLEAREKELSTLKESLEKREIEHRSSENILQKRESKLIDKENKLESMRTSIKQIQADVLREQHNQGLLKELRLSKSALEIKEKELFGKEACLDVREEELCSVKESLEKQEIEHMSRESHLQKRQIELIDKENKLEGSNSDADQWMNKDESGSNQDKRRCLREGLAEHIKAPPNPQNSGSNVEESESSLDNCLLNRKLSVGDIWSCFDAKDNLPRSQVQITRIITNRDGKVMLRVLWLKPCPVYSGEKAWIDAHLPVTCGIFKCSRESNESPEIFSHLVSFKGNGPWTIIPRRGETWAIYKDWDISTWSSNPQIHGNCNYEIVEILSWHWEGSSPSLRAAYLNMIPGSQSSFECRSYERHSFLIKRSDLFRFSHRVPSIKNDCINANGIPHRIFELDKRSLPRGIL